MSEWTDEKLAQQERALRSGEAAAASQPDLTAGETLQAIGRDAGEGLANLGRAVAN